MVEKTRIIEVHERAGAFSTVFRKFKSQKKDYNTEDLGLLRQLLSNEKARLLNVVKVKQPNSLYKLAKILKRDFLKRMIFWEFWLCG